MALEAVLFMWHCQMTLEAICRSLDAPLKQAQRNVMRSAVLMTGSSEGVIFQWLKPVELIHICTVLTCGTNFGQYGEGTWGAAGVLAPPCLISNSWHPMSSTRYRHLPCPYEGSTLVSCSASHMHYIEKIKLMHCSQQSSDDAKSVLPSQKNI